VPSRMVGIFTPLESVTKCAPVVCSFAAAAMLVERENGAFLRRTIKSCVCVCHFDLTVLLGFVESLALTRKVNTASGPRLTV
jgi:hypothetical protein